MKVNAYIKSVVKNILSPVQYGALSVFGKSSLFILGDEHSCIPIEVSSALGQPPCPA